MLPGEVRDVRAQVETAVELARSGAISRKEALLRVDATSLPELLHPRVDPGADEDYEILGKGLGASPGAAAGRVIFSAGETRQGEERVVLVVDSLSPDDKEGLPDAAAVVTGHDGVGSHDLVLLRGMGIPVVTGCEGLKVEDSEVRFGERTVEAGDCVTVDGSDGIVFLGEAPVLQPTGWEDLEELLRWADEARTLGVRANADTAEEAKKARSFGAGGVGLCRTERMFTKGGRLGVVRRMILAEGGSEEEAQTLSELEEGACEDFEELFRAMSGLPVAVRLLDPPLHEFLPNPQDLRERLSDVDGAGGEEAGELRRTLEAVEALEETNPMLGTRGVRLGLLRPQIYRMQARAVAVAAGNVRREGQEPVVEILVPLVQFPEEIKKMKEILREELEDEDIPIGLTVEAPRACAAAGSLAREVPFLSFGTNDLTQTTLGISRDDAKGGFLPEYLEKSVLGEDPFEYIDEEGVGRLIGMARDLGREANPALTLGVCGEHGGEPESIRFFHEAGLDYVSCSPYRVPVARLAAAQAALGHPLPNAGG